MNVLIQDRGLAPVIGFILVFSIVVISWTAYQGLVVPQQEHGAELQHNEAVQTRFLELNDAVNRASVTGADESVTVRLGALYPRRVLAIGLATSSGTIETESVGPSNIRLENMRALDPEADDYWDGSTARNLPTTSVVYRPSYSRYAGAPTTRYSTSIIYNDFHDGPNLTLSEQSVVNGRQLTLIALVGTLDETRNGPVTIDISPISASSNRLAVTSGSTDPINVTLPTRLSEANWTALLADEICESADCSSPADDAADRHVLPAVRVTGDRVVIPLEAGVTYDLRMAKVAVGAGGESEPASYITTERTPNPTVYTGTEHSIVIEALDRFNNPVSGVEIDASAPRGTFESSTVVTRSKGHAPFVYTAPSSPGPVTLDFTIRDGTPANETVSITLDVQSVVGGPGGPGPP